VLIAGDGNPATAQIANHYLRCGYGPVEFLDRTGFFSWSREALTVATRFTLSRRDPNVKACSLLAAQGLERWAQVEVAGPEAATLTDILFDKHIGTA